MDTKKERRKNMSPNSKIKLVFEAAIIQNTMQLRVRWASISTGTYTHIIRTGLHTRPIPLKGKKPHYMIQIGLTLQSTLESREEDVNRRK